MGAAKLDLETLIDIIWLTRPDLRVAYDDLGRSRDFFFRSWCLGPGSKEYAAVREFPDARAQSGIDEPMPDFAHARPFAITWAMYGLWHLRTDLQKRFDITTTEGAEGFVWWYVQCSQFDTDLELNLQPWHWDHILSPADGVEQDAGLPISTLMHWVYRSRADLQETFDLSTPSGRRDFKTWYILHGLGDPACFAMLPRQLIDRLRAPAENLPQDGFAPISEIMALLWQSRPDLQASMDLTTRAGRARFVRWYHAIGINEIPLAWTVSDKAAAALTQPSELPGTSGTVRLPFGAFLVHEASTALRTRFPIVDQADADRFVDWITGPEGRDGLPSTHDLLDPAPARRPRNLLSPPESKPTIASPAPIRPRLRRDGVTLIGFPRGILGIGEDIRMMSRALDTAGVPHSVKEILPSPQTANWEPSLAERIRDDVEYQTQVFVLTAMETARVLAVHGLAPFGDGVRIGYWPWEFDQMPVGWNFAPRLVDEIWASTEHTAKAYRTDPTVPVRVMPMTVDVPDVASRSRKDFDLPADGFLFLFAFDVQSSMERKNPWGPIKAFQEAFPGDRDVGLVVKTSNTTPDDPDMQALHALAARDPRILIVDRTLRRADWVGLLKVVDCFVSLHRCEGFGRILAEALLLEIPVIATDYSGSCDFLDRSTGYPVAYRLRTVEPGAYPYADGLVWAEPDVRDAARQMRRVRADPPAARVTAQAGGAVIRQRHSAAAVGRAYRARFVELGFLDLPAG